MASPDDGYTNILQNAIQPVDVRKISQSSVRQNMLRLRCLSRTSRGMYSKLKREASWS